MKKKLSILLAVLLTATLLAPSAIGLAEDGGYNGVDNFQIVTEPTTVTLFATFSELGAPEGHHVIWQEGAKLTGISMENVANPSIVEENEALNVMLAGGVLPDLIHGMKGNLLPIAQQGGFLPLSELIAEYAPNIQRYFDTIPEARVGSTAADGEIYFIEGSLAPLSGGEDSTALIPTMAFFIREDWLEILNLPMPTTLEELKNTLYAFRNDDPNGNNEKDEIPFFYRDKSPVGLYQLFGVGGDWALWSIDEATNQVVFGRSTEEYKNALRELALWYKDGVIDPELLTRGGQARQELLGNNQGGLTFDWYESTANMNYNEDILAAVPTIKWTPMLPPADVNGVVKNVYSGAPTSGYAWGISKDCADPVAVVKFMDFWFSLPGSTLMTYGVEGQSYTLVDGKPVFTEEAYAYGGGIPNYMRTLGAGGIFGVLEDDISLKTEIGRQTYLLYREGAGLQHPFPNLAFNEEEEAAVADYMGAIDTLWQQYEQQVLYGEKDVDASWEGYLAELRALELNEVVAAYNNAYARYVAEFN